MRALHTYRAHITSPHAGAGAAAAVALAVVYSLYDIIAVFAFPP